MPAAPLRLVAARNVDWRPVIAIYYEGDPLPLTGATIRMQIRLWAGAPGSPLVDVPGIAFTDAASPTAAKPTRRVLTLEPIVSDATLAPLLTALNLPEPGDSDRYHHDIVVTYADTISETLAEGEFFLKPGVTRDG